MTIALTYSQGIVGFLFLSRSAYANSLKLCALKISKNPDRRESMLEKLCIFCVTKCNQQDNQDNDVVDYVFALKKTHFHNDPSKWGNLLCWDCTPASSLMCMIATRTSMTNKQLENEFHLNLYDFGIIESLIFHRIQIIIDSDCLKWFWCNWKNKTTKSKKWKYY